MDASALNPQILPGTPLKRDEHRKIGWIAAIVVVIAIILWTVYLSSPSRTVPGTSQSQQTDPRAELAAILNQSPAQVPPQDMSRTAEMLTKTKTAAAPAERAKVAGILSSISEQ